MTGAHSPWPLFSNDLYQAQQWVNDQLRRTPTDKQLGHQALSLGLTETVRDILNQGNLNLEDATRRQWKFRLARLSGTKNPYAELIPADLQKFTDLQMDRAQSTGEPAVISVPGGIGDHLEVISSLLEWNRMDEHPLILQVSSQRQEALAPLIASTPQLELDSNIHRQAIPSLAMREWLCRHFGQICYRTWVTNIFTSQVETKGILCCWRAKGEGNLLSAYLRSVPFPLVLDFYIKIQKLNPESSLIDISDWKPEELITLKKHGVQCINPRKIGLEGLIETCKSRQVITIDTALAHLCAVTGIKATVLLNYIPDERWVELSHPESCYRKYLKIIRQTQFCNWEESISSILDCGLS